RVYLAVGEGLDLAVAGDAVHGFDVILVVHRQLGAAVDGGDMKRKAGLVVLQQQPGALPAGGDDAAARPFGFPQVANDHDRAPRLPKDAAGAAVERALWSSTCARLADRMSMTTAISSALMTRSHRHLSTWPRLPEVSMIRP